MRVTTIFRSSLGLSSFGAALLLALPVVLVCCTGDDPAYVPASAGEDASPGVDGAVADAGATDASLPDDGGAIDAAVETDAGDGSTLPKQVFITDDAFDGRMTKSGGIAGAGGLADADQHCMAAAATPFPGRTFHAYLSTAGVAASMRIGSGPWYVGSKLVGGLAELTSDNLLAPIDVTAAGVMLSTSFSTWTGTSGAGVATTQRCADWTLATAADNGTVGTVGGADDTWTNGGAVTCDTRRRLYCFEQ